MNACAWMVRPWTTWEWLNAFDRAVMAAGLIPTTTICNGKDGDDGIRHTHAHTQEHARQKKLSSSEQPQEAFCRSPHACLPQKKRRAMQQLASRKDYTRRHYCKCCCGRLRVTHLQHTR